MITLTPSFYFENRTEYRLTFAQEYLTRGKGFENVHGQLVALPKCNMAFHWPRVDLDQLLSVRRLDIADCHWSGGFKIDTVNSFHVNMRSVTK